MPGDHSRRYISNTDPRYIKWGVRLKSYRNDMELSQKEVGYKLGVTRNAVINWEQGHSWPKFHMLVDYCTILNIMVEDILD